MGCACSVPFVVTKTSIIMKFITSFHTRLTWEVRIAYDKSLISNDRLNKRTKFDYFGIFSPLVRSLGKLSLERSAEMELRLEIGCE